MLSLVQVDMKSLKMNISFGEIERMSKWKFKNIVKDRVAKFAFEYLIEQKKNQKKAKRLNYYDLKMPVQQKDDKTYI